MESGELNKSKLKYDLDELFMKQPFFDSALIQFRNCDYDPNDDPLIIALMVNSHKLPEEYFTLVERLQKEKYE